VQLATDRLPATGGGQVMADTPICAPLMGFARIIKVVICTLPVEPISMSASPAPNTVLPGCWSLLSTMPLNAGAVPKIPVQRAVPKEAGSNSHCRETTPIVPSPPMEISGSLLPSVSSRGVSVNVGGGLAVTWSAIARSPAVSRLERKVPAASRGDVRMSASQARSSGFCAAESVAAPDATQSSGTRALRLNGRNRRDCQSRPTDLCRGLASAKQLRERRALGWRWRLLPLLRPLQVHLDRRAALRALAGLVLLHRPRLCERHVEFVGLVLGMPAPGALKVHLHDHRNPAIHGG